MDSHSLGLLEFQTIREIVAGYASSALGKQRALDLTPQRDLRTIRDWQSQTSEMAEALAAGLAPPFGGLTDVRGLVKRAGAGAALDAEELAEVVESVRAIGELDRWLARIGEQFPRIGGLRMTVGDFSSLANEIEGCIDSRGIVLDTASRRLAGIRAEIASTEERIRETLRQMLRSAEVRRCLRYPNFTTVGHHYVLPVSKDYRGEIQGAVHRTSSTNETVFIEPQAIAEHSARLSFLRSKEQKEIKRILRWLSGQVGRVSASLLVTLETLGELDLIHARGRYSLDYQMAPPDFNRAGQVYLTRARHPILEHLIRRRLAEREEMATPRTDENASRTNDDAPVTTELPQPALEGPEHVIPIDLHLGFEFRLMVITGPNTGGKTVALKTLALLAVMAQSGLHITAGQGSKLPIFDQIYCDIGDEQSLQQSLSTFSSHIRRISEILGKASEKSLVLFDELGAGTDPAEGAALGRAILDELDSIGCLAIVTTHIGDLKTYPLANPRATNAAVEFDDETLRPLYTLRIGDIGRSNALKIARRLQLADHLIDRAGNYLEQSRGQDLPEWEILTNLRREAEEAKQKALDLQAEAERTLDSYRQKLADLQKQSERDQRLVEARERLKAGDRVVVERFGYDRPGRVVKLNPKKRIAVVAVGAMQWDVPLDEVIPQVLNDPTTVESEAQAKAKQKGTLAATSAKGKARRLDEFE